jgi:peptide-methionine (R)-S-oxide reductase
MARQNLIYHCCLGVVLAIISSGLLLAIDQSREKSDSRRDKPSAGEVSSPAGKKSKAASKSSAFPRFIRPDSYWRKKLTSSQYYVARRKGTEPAFSGIYWDHHDDGIYTCVGCGTPLFDSEAKFDSGTGWPSYWQVVNKNLIKLHPDTAGGVIRTEVNCRICDAHMGHVFDDGPRPTGLRFCINSASIKFVSRKKLPEYLDQWRADIGLPPLEKEKKESDAPPADSSVDKDGKNAETKPGN